MRVSPLFVAAAVIASLASCSAKVDGVGGSGSAQTVGVEVVPGEIELVQNQETSFSALVTGTSDTAVTWEVVEESAGGAVSAAGLYTAPAAIGTFHVRAVSRADRRISALGRITVKAPTSGSVAVSPKSTTLVAGGTTTFTATTTGLSGGVSWRVKESTGCGSVSSAGVYTAPTAATTCHVVATSVSDTTRTDEATVVVTAAAAPSVVTISMNPTTLTMDACTAHTFAATVSGSSDTAVVWSITEGSAGGQVSGGVYTAPSTPGTYHVVATAHASTSAKVTATVTVNEHVLSVAIDPPTVSLSPLATQQFTALVTTTCGTFAAN